MRIWNEIDPDAEFGRPELEEATLDELWDDDLFDEEVWDELWAGGEPTTEDLEAIERIHKRRDAVRAARPSGAHEALVLRFLLETLDEMEEIACVRGPADPSVADGWETVEILATFRRNGGPPPRCHEARPTDRGPLVHDPAERPRSFHDRKSVHSSQTSSSIARLGQ